MAKDVEVKTRLRLDDLASGLLDKIRAGFRGADEAREEAQEGFGAFAKETAAHFAAIQIGPAISQVVEYGKAFFHAGVEAQAADQSIAGLIASVQGAKWSEAHDQAEALGDALDDIAVDAMRAGDEVAGAFQRMLEITGATEEGIARAKHETADLAQITRVLGGSTAQLAQEYSFAAEGAIKTKSALFQLLQPTGIFGADVKKASAYWASITEESRIKLLEYGVGQVANRLEKAEPTMGDLLTTMENIAGIAKEKFGQEIVEALMPEIEDFVRELKDGRNAIDGMAEGMGKEVGRYVREAAREVRKGFEYVRDHYAEIKQTVVAAFEHAKTVVTWILEHKEELALAFGAKAIAPAVGQVARGASALANTAAQGIPALGIAGTGGGALMAGATVAAFAAAVAAWALAIDQWRDLMASTGGGKSEAEMDQDARKDYFDRLAAAPTVGPLSEKEIKQFEENRRVFVEMAQELGHNARAAGELADKAWQAHRAIRTQVEPIEKVADVFRRLEETGGVGDLDVSKPVAMIDEGFTAAMKSNNVAVQQYIADILVKSKSLQGAFLQASGLTAEGFESLASLVEGASKEFADKLKQVASIESAKSAAKPEAPKVVFNGATINIKQDFRNQDPDRVAIVFRRDIAQAATRRYSASTGSPFGT